MELGWYFLTVNVWSVKLKNKYHRNICHGNSDKVCVVRGFSGENMTSSPEEHWNNAGFHLFFKEEPNNRKWCQHAENESSWNTFRKEIKSITENVKTKIFEKIFLSFLLVWINFLNLICVRHQTCENVENSEVKKKVISFIWFSVVLMNVTISLQEEHSSRGEWWEVCQKCPKEVRK